MVLLQNFIETLGVHNENLLVEKTYVSEELQIQNLECFLLKSNRNNLNLRCSNTKTKIFAYTSEILQSKIEKPNETDWRAATYLELKFCV